MRESLQSRRASFYHGAKISNSAVLPLAGNLLGSAFPKPCSCALSAIGRDWEEVERELFTPEEIAESDLRVALMTEIIRARREKGITQKQLEALSGVKQPVIARMESGESDPRIGTVMKALAAIGMTLKVTPIQ